MPGLIVSDELPLTLTTVAVPLTEGIARLASGSVTEAAPVVGLAELNLALPVDETPPCT